MPGRCGLVRSLPFLIGATALACQGDVLVEPSLGTLEISTSTTGADLDTDGYTVQVDAGPIQTISSAASVRTSVPVGYHTVQLGGLAANCVVPGENLRHVALSAGDTTTVSFSVTCIASGTIDVTSSTNGPFPDPDGYLIAVDGVVRSGVGVSATGRVNGIEAGHHTVELRGVAANCAVGGTSPRELELAQGHTATLVFSVDCTSASLIALTAYDYPSNHFRIFVVNPDGSGWVWITPDGGDERQPVWSRDKTELAYAAGSDLYLMHINDATRTRLAGGTSVGSIRWSGDNSMLAFESDTLVSCPPPRDWELCSETQLWVIRADGSGLRKLSRGKAPSWSPHGQSIAFADEQIYSIHADGTHRFQLTNGPGGPYQPAWSPDGSKIAFVEFTAIQGVKTLVSQIFLMNPDGTGVVKLSDGSGADEQPTWSPDGSRIAFTTYPDLTSSVSREVTMMDRDGSHRLALTDGSKIDGDPTWSPDGTKLAFSRWDFWSRGGMEVYVMNADGSGQTKVSDGSAGSPTWAGESPSW